VEIEKKITDKTKAIVVTHMWGIPCDMDAITVIAKKHNLRLLEDCSHAHGAKFNEQKVGTFGDAAVWSLQGQKTVTGGEGGILLTDDGEIHTRALLLGQYNKRCKQEIPRDHPLYQYALTGFGLKLRAHPLAIAMADQQFDHFCSEFPLISLVTMSR
jgi:dTDP-4-amino-4,6-dideoxygalactose transaminase